jgi:hypothetical protein
MENSCMVWRAWFDGTLSRDQMAALLYMRAGTGKGPAVYARELEQRFGWSAPTALAVLRALRRRGIVEMRRSGGVTYVVDPDLGIQLPPTAQEHEDATRKNPGNETQKNPDAPTHKNQGSGNLGNGNLGDKRRDSLDAPPSGDPPPRNIPPHATRVPFGDGDPRSARQDDVGFAKEEIRPVAPERIILANWKSAKFFREEYEFRFTGKVDETVMGLEQWCWWLDYFGGAPAHLKTSPARRHALEIAHELHAVGSVQPRLAMAGLAYAICCANERRKDIRSLALIAEPLVRKAMVDDDTWAYDLPARRSESFTQAHNLATKAVNALETFDYGIEIDRRKLLSTFCLEGLRQLNEMYTWDGVVDAINYVTRTEQRQPEGNVIVGWEWFAHYIDAARAAKVAAAPAQAQPAPPEPAPPPQLPPKVGLHQPSQANVEAACEWLRSYLGNEWHNSHKVSHAATRAGIGHRAYQAASELLNRQKARNPSNGAWMTALPGVPALPGPAWPGSAWQQLQKKHREEQRQLRKA